MVQSFGFCRFWRLFCGVDAGGRLLVGRLLLLLWEFWFHSSWSCRASCKSSSSWVGVCVRWDVTGGLELDAVVDDCGFCVACMRARRACRMAAWRPMQLWSGPNLCCRQKFLLHSLHVIGTSSFFLQPFMVHLFLKTFFFSLRQPLSICAEMASSGFLSLLMNATLWAHSGQIGICTSWFWVGLWSQLCSENL